MTINYDDMLGLIEANDQARDQYNATGRALEKAVWEAREAHDPQPGEAWRVILPWERGVREVIPAIKVKLGWVTDPGYFGEHDIDDGYIPESVVLPLNRVAARPHHQRAHQPPQPTLQLGAQP